MEEYADTLWTFVLLLTSEYDDSNVPLKVCYILNNISINEKWLEDYSRGA